MKIFLVEDSFVIRRLVTQRLERMPGVVVVGEAACDTSAATLIHATQPDVVLTDLSLVNGSGISLVSKLRNRGFTGHVAVLTSQDLEPIRRACFNAGADAFYDKATGLETLFGDLSNMTAPAMALAA